MIIGRSKEIEALRYAYNSDRAELVAVYGRRRVGKTFLVRETFKNKFTFTYSGVPNVSTRVQLKHFHQALIAQGMKKTPVPVDWFDAFMLLYDFIREKKGRRKVVFIDELPWMDAPRSSFMPAFENFWNGWLSALDDVVLIICGSATSWIINKVIRNHGGLYNRVTSQIYLQPFTLKECEQYSRNHKLGLRRRHIMEAYMVFGGIPYYWSLLKPGLSLAQNIDNLFFRKDAVLVNEYRNLYASLFRNPEPYERIVTALATKKIGMIREELVSELKIKDCGNMTRWLEDLENCGFIRRYSMPGSKTKNSVFQLIDNFTLFHFKFLVDKKRVDDDFWSKIQISPLYSNWVGLAFERVCLLHTEQIKKAIGVSGMLTYEYAWRVGPDGDRPGAQIDLLIERSDRAINICEMKFYSGKFTLGKEDDEKIKERLNRFSEASKTKKALLLTMITAEGLTDNEYARDIPIALTADCLFE